MPKMLQFRGPERIVLDSTSVLDIQQRTVSDHATSRSITDYAATEAPTYQETQVQLTVVGNIPVREPMNEQAVLDRATGRVGTYNGDAVFLADLLAKERRLHAIAIRTWTAGLERVQLEYEASKNLWRKRYDEQGPEPDMFESTGW